MNKLTLAIAALEKIANPINYLQKEAEKEGKKLDGIAAIHLSKNDYWLREIAIKALKEIRESELDLSPCCQKPVRYLDCEDCRKKGRDCIDICTECGATVGDDSHKEPEPEEPPAGSEDAYKGDNWGERDSDKAHNR